MQDIEGQRRRTVLKRQKEEVRAPKTGLMREEGKIASNKARGFRATSPFHFQGNAR